jgi:hypothetical protein
LKVPPWSPCSLVVKQLSGAAHAGLDLVKNQQQAMFRGERAQIPQKLVGERPDAGLALDRLQHHRDCLGGDQPLHRVEIVHPRLGKAGDFWLEQRLERLLAGGRHGRQRAAVKAPLEGDDLVSAILVQGAVFAGQLDRALIGFRA